jgi:hypothetical protein
MRFIVVSLGLVLIAGACATSGTAASDQAATATGTRPRTNVITLQELRESRAPSLADVVRQLRPGWSTQVTVFVNNDPFGGFEQLRSLSVQNTAEVRFLTRSEAQIKWGSRYQEVIQVITR